jgi:hypothetical protein
MSDRGSSQRSKLKLKDNPLAVVSFFVATLSLLASLYQGYLNTKFVELVQSGVARGETARTCKELIDGYFQIKFKASALAAAASRNPQSSELFPFESDVANAVSRFAALGTYLANFQGEAKRQKYTALSYELSRIAKASRGSPASEIDKLFGPADSMFAEMNADCVSSINR